MMLTATYFKLQICKKYHNCQRCINKDYNDCPEWAPYKYKGRQDPTTGQKYLECLNKECDFILLMIVTII